MGRTARHRVPRVSSEPSPWGSQPHGFVLGMHEGRDAWQAGVGVASLPSLPDLHMQPPYSYLLSRIITAQPSRFTPRAPKPGSLHLAPLFSEGHRHQLEGQLPGTPVPSQHFTAARHCPSIPNRKGRGQECSEWSEPSSPSSSDGALQALSLHPVLVAQLCSCISCPAF